MLEKALSELHTIKSHENPILVQALPELALELFNVIVSNSSLDQSNATLAARLFNMASKCSNVDKKHLRNSLEGCKSKDAGLYQKLKAGSA